MAIISLCSGIAGLSILFGIGSVAALVTGYMARNQIDESQGREGGRGMALAGIVMGWIGIAFALLFILFFVVIFGVLFESLPEIIEKLPSISPTPSFPQ
jgi:hypothetical protein